MISIWIPLVIAACIVLQGTLNQNMAANWGLIRATSLNNFVVTILTIVVLLWSGRQSWTWPNDFKWWHVVPGLCGAIIVLGLPVGLKRLGPSMFFVLLIAAQIIFGTMWTLWVDGQNLSWQRWAGTALVLLGAVLASI